MRKQNFNQFHARCYRPLLRIVNEYGLFNRCINGNVQRSLAKFIWLVYINLPCQQSLRQLKIHVFGCMVEVHPFKGSTR